jgi:hypothetical protein
MLPDAHERVSGVGQPATGGAATAGTVTLFVVRVVQFDAPLQAVTVQEYDWSLDPVFCGALSVVLLCAGIAEPPAGVRVHE